MSASAPLAAATATVHPRAASPRARVLIADDERSIANTLSEILNLSGFDARAVYDGQAGLEMIEQFSPDLLITDVMMPRLTGVELAIAAQQLCPDCKIVLFSGHAGTTELVSDLRKRGHDFPLLTKPMHPAKLMEHVDGWLS